MPTFIYKAVTPQGQIVKSKMNDASKLGCVKKLKRNGLHPISVKQTFTSTKSAKTLRQRNVGSQQGINNKVTTAYIKPKQKKPFIARLDKLLTVSSKITFKDIKVFSQNFYLLKKAQFNNIHALSTVIQTTENPRFRMVLEDILSGVEAGEFMYTTMEYYEDIFPYIYINMIKVGELSGSLEKSLEQGVRYLEDSESLSSKLKKILIPNIIMFIALIVMLFVAVIVGLPLLQEVFESFGTKDEIPAITLWFAGVVDKILEFWYIPVGIVLGSLAMFYIYITTPRGRYNFDRFKYKMPVFGKLVYLLDFSRLMKAVLLNLQNGMRVQDSLEVSKNVVKNTVMIDIIETAINNIYVGQSWIQPFEDSRLSTHMATEMLKIGMQTDLVEMLEKLIIYMQQDIDNTMEKIMKVLPEIVYAIVGVVLIFFVIVVLVPAIQVYMGSFLFSAYGF